VLLPIYAELPTALQSLTSRASRQLPSQHMQFSKCQHINHCTSNILYIFLHNTIVDYLQLPTLASIPTAYTQFTLAFSDQSWL
jgi:hypothetical protein